MTVAWLEVPTPDGDLHRLAAAAEALHRSARATGHGADELDAVVRRLAGGVWEGRAADALDLRTRTASRALRALADDQQQAGLRVDAHVRAWTEAHDASRRAHADLEAAVAGYLHAAPSALHAVAAHLEAFLQDAMSAVVPFADHLLAGVHAALARLRSWSPPPQRPSTLPVPHPGDLPPVTVDGVLRGLQSGGSWGVSHLLDGVGAVQHLLGGAVSGAVRGVHAAEHALAAAVADAHRRARAALERLEEVALGTADVLGHLALDVGRQVVHAVAEAVHAAVAFCGAVLTGVRALLHALDQIALGLLGLAAVLAHVLGPLAPVTRRGRRMPEAEARAADRDAADRFRDADVLAAVVDASHLAENAYQASGAPTGFERVDPQPAPGRDGFHAVVYRTTTGEVVVAFAGTDPHADDWGQDAQNAAGLPTSQGLQAVALARQVAEQYGSHVSFTGHSLGGGLAAMASLATGRPATTFNAAGIGDGNYAAAVRANPGRASEAGITNYHAPNDILTVGTAAGGLDPAAGAQVTVASTTRNPLDAHSIGNLHFPDVPLTGAHR